MPLACGIEVMGSLGGRDKHKVLRSCDYYLLKGLVGAGFEGSISAQENWLLFKDVTGSFLFESTV